MDTNIIQKKLLLIEIPFAKQLQILSFCKKKNLSVQIINKSEEEFQIKELLFPNSKNRRVEANSTSIHSIQKESKVSEEKPEDREILLFFGYNSKELDAFLTAYREEGIPPVSLKAIVTANNLNWSIKKLRSELLIEHKNLHKK